MSAYYNENDPFAAAWLGELIKDGLIAPGLVDTRSIEDVTPNDLKGFTQCHFFAGIGVWSLALRVAGWPDDRPVWTGSCPCQPFSAAGKGTGFADERHLWPAWYHLIAHGKRPDYPVLGEQVASKAGRAWFDLVSADMEILDHGCGAVDTSAASLGAPFIGQRLYWLAATNDARSQGWIAAERSRGADQLVARQIGVVGGLAAPDSWEREQQSSERSADIQRETHESSGQRDGLGDHSAGVDRLAQPTSGQSGYGNIQSSRQHRQQPQDAGDCDDSGIPLHPVEYWRDADWLLCRDPNGARFRPVEPDTFPLVDARSLRNRLGAVRGAGNALNISQAACFVEAVMEHLAQ